MNNTTDTPVAARPTCARRSPREYDPGANTINFDPTVFATPQTITLSGSQLELTKTTGTETIQGPAAGVTVSGGNASRVFQLNGCHGVISGLTITGGTVAGSGGGLDNEGTVTLTDCTVSGNTANVQRRRPGQHRHGHADQLHHQRQHRRASGGGIVDQRRHGHADQLHHQRQHRTGNRHGGGVWNDGTAS